MADALQDEDSIKMKIKFMTSNGGALKAAKGPMVSTNEERVHAPRNRFLSKRETRSKFLVKKTLGSNSIPKRELGQVLK